MSGRVESQHMLWELLVEPGYVVHICFEHLHTILTIRIRDSFVTHKFWMRL